MPERHPNTLASSDRGFLKKPAIQDPRANVREWEAFRNCLEYREGFLGKSGLGRSTRRRLRAIADFP
jgi:hypothetical protein